MLLGSVGPATERTRAKRNSEASLFGTGGSQVTLKDMDAYCTFAKSRGWSGRQVCTTPAPRIARERLKGHAA
ncbi:hypothetical protein CORC01_10797 [Colletotrichum orchidophilum]|uniref:Uncharacterized protein n=1 Tax=Colletotrichum orchidophilum TaxID=1209926 RepID=A0A1G4AXK8_9PEZI|nr:uncharacterized protein CORC01_10797 [Colletotrichum orchidophilum]OHE93898.1 hypothetical protein CORC01_10797 [Colletotrichum orchidophilum]